MLTENKLEYVAEDEKRQVISWVRTINTEGDTIIYHNEEADDPDFDDPETEIRTFATPGNWTAANCGSQSGNPSTGRDWMKDVCETPP